MKEKIHNFIKDQDGPKGISIKSWLEKDKLALVLIDLQNYITDKKYSGIFSSGGGENYYYKRLEEKVVPNIHKILTVFRGLKILVVFTRIAFTNKSFLDIPAGIGRLVLSEGLFDSDNNPYCLHYKDYSSQIDKRFEPNKNEVVILKSSSGAFCSSNIDLILRSNNISRLVFVGGLTDGCVSSSLREAVDRGYLCTLIEDACITSTKEDHEAALKSLNKFYSWVTTTNELLFNIQQ